MHPETFERHEAVHDYAERNGLTYAREGSPAFDKRLRTLSLEQYQIIAVHTRRGIRRVLMFSKATGIPLGLVTSLARPGGQVSIF